MRVFVLFALTSLLLGLAGAPSGAADSAPAEGPARLTWDILGQVTYARESRSFLPVYGSELLGYGGERVVVRGFMMEKDHAHHDDRFVLSAYPKGKCFLCAPGGVTTVIEVVPREHLELHREAIFIEGTLEFVAEDPLGILYRVVDAVRIEEGDAPR